MFLFFTKIVAPVIKERPQIKRQVKQKVVIECYVGSGAKPQCTWFRETTVVKESARHQVNIRKVSKGEYAVALEIDKPTAADKGSYKLVCKNEKGEAASQSVLVDVQGKMPRG